MTNQSVVMNVELIDLRFISVDGKTYDLRSETVQINITESIETPFIHGWIAFNDSNGILELQDGMTGGYLSIEFRSAPTHPSFSKIFWIYKIGDDKALTTSFQTNNREVKFYFASQSMLGEMQGRFSKSYTNLPIHEIVKDACKEFMQIENVTIEETSNSINLIVPFAWSPIGTISYCCERAISAKNGDSGYIFFENGLGHNFVSISNLLSKESKFKLTMDEGDNKSVQSLNRIISYHVSKYLDLLDSISSRRFGSLSYDVDTSDIRLSTNTHLFSDYVSKTTILGNYTTTSTSYNNQFGYVYSSHDGNSKVRSQNWSRYSMLQDNQIKAILQGDTRKNAGDVVSISWPSKDRNNGANAKLDGTWLIHSLTHIIDKSHRFSQEAKLIKDGLTSSETNFEAVNSNP